MKPLARSQIEVLVWTLAVAAVYLGAARLGLSMAFPGAKQVTPVWPPTGIALASLLVLGYRVWPGIALGAFLANLPDAPASTACAIAAGNTLEAAAGAWLLGRVGFRISLERMRDVLALVLLAAGLSTTLSATIGVASLCLWGLHTWSQFGSLWRLWWLGDAMGALVMAPPLLAWAARPRLHWKPLRLAEAAMLIATLLALSLTVFLGRWPRTITGHSPVYTVFPLIIWAALRFGQRETTLSTLLLTAIAIFGAVNGQGPFAGGPVNESLDLLVVFMSVVAVTGMLLAAAASERNKAEGERAHLLREANEANRMKDEFLAMLAHELRNPLSPMLSAAEILQMRGMDPSSLRRAGEVVERQVRTMARLLDDLLDVSRITRGKVELRKELLDLKQVAARAIETARPLMERHGHRVSVSLPAQALAVEGDPIRLEQVLVNLLNNAAKFTDPGGSVGLRVWREEGEALVEVSDSGRGVPPEVLSRIFDLFVQSDPTIDRSKGGLGIGLTVVKSLVEMHGGRVEARSEGPGKGSAFTVRLPESRKASAQVRGAERAGAAAQAGGEPPLRILVVDDNKDVAETIGLLLETLGHEVRLVQDGPAALREARSFRPDAVLLDIGLPGMDGYQVARLLREEAGLEKALLVAITGYGQEEDRRLTREAGFDHHLLKPIELESLRRVLRGGPPLLPAGQ